MKEFFASLCVALLICSGTSETFACSVPPPQLTKHHADLIRDTDNIVLAKVVGPSPEYGDNWGRKFNLAKFSTMEVVKGHAPSGFVMEQSFFSEKQPGEVQDFDGHSELLFWEKNITRQWNAPDCKMRPFFHKDRVYLVFLDHPHWMAYEEVNSQDDLWLNAVRKLVKNPSLETGLSVGAHEWLAMAHGAFVGTLRNCSSPTLSVDTVLTGDFGDNWLYSEKSGYWPFEGCTVGKRYFVMTMSPERSSLPFYSSSIYEIEDGSFNIEAKNIGEGILKERTIKLDDVLP